MTQKLGCHDKIYKMGLKSLYFAQTLNLLTVFLCISILCCHTAESRRVSMKIVDEPSNYGYNSQQNTEETSAEKLKMRIQPSNFSGPPHLKVLTGKCFSKIDNEYKYDFCPFANVTQHEQSLRWNPYSGVLGVWQEWEISNNTYTAMMLREGDPCGSNFRSVKVVFECGDENAIVHVSEPETCHYVIQFKTIYVCHPHAMLVYPTLPAELQHRWDLLEGRWLNEELTQQGYDRALNAIFEDAGVRLPEAKKEAQHKEAAEKKSSSSGAKDETTFLNLDTCKDEYKKLKDEIADLKNRLEATQNSRGRDYDEDALKAHYPDYDDF